MFSSIRSFESRTKYIILQRKPAWKIDDRFGDPIDVQVSETGTGFFIHYAASKSWSDGDERPSSFSGTPGRYFPFDVENFADKSSVGFRCGNELFFWQILCCSLTFVSVKFYSEGWYFTGTRAYKSMVACMYEKLAKTRVTLSLRREQKRMLREPSLAQRITLTN